MTRPDISSVEVPALEWEVVLEMVRGERFPADLPDSLKPFETPSPDTNYARVAAVAGRRQPEKTFDSIREGINGIVGEGWAFSPLSGMLEALREYKARSGYFERWEGIIRLLGKAALLEPGIIQGIPLKRRDYEYRRRAIGLIAGPPHRDEALPLLGETLYGVLTELHRRSSDDRYQGAPFVHDHIVQAAEAFRAMRPNVFRVAGPERSHSRS